MSKKSSNEEILDKIHRILDNTSSESSDKNNNQYLNSLKRRVSTSHIKRYPSQTVQPLSQNDLTPRVVIRKKQDTVKESRIEDKEIVQFKEVKSENILLLSAGTIVSDKELYEVENPTYKSETIPEFIEVKPKQNEKEELAENEVPFTITINPEDDEDESLPQWQSVDDEDEPKKQITTFGQATSEKNKKEITQKETDTLNKNQDEKTRNIWEPLSSKKLKKETSKTVHFKQIPDEQIVDTHKGQEPFIQIKKTDADQSIDKNEHEDKKGYKYNGYRLYKKNIVIDDEDKRTIHFFAKEPPETGEPAYLPKDYEVKINRKTGVPYIRKKQK